jgi:multidrug transporter EmrE-like cation transporter
MVISMVTHLMSLSRFDVSFAFPFISIAYVLVLLYGYFAMGENVTALRVAGVSLVVAGTVLIARS